MSNITYSKHDDYYLPDLTFPKQEKCFLGRFGRLRLAYLKAHRKILYVNLLTSCGLSEHLAETDEMANQMLETLMEQMAERQGITEQLKSTDQMAWIGAMNNIKACATEIVLNEIIYA